ncbi:DHA2 family efflux MFS transporter permease subunit, partial [bacterium]
MAAVQTLPRAAVPPLDVNHAARWIILIGLMLAAVMEVLDTTIVNVALPTMAGNFGATTTEIAWISTGYILSNVIFLPMTAFLTGLFGRRNYLSVSILIFIVASFLCGLSHSLIELVVWRILQGAGGAALLSTAQATIRQIFPGKEQPLVQTVFLLGIIVGPTLGPTLGGWITDNYTWSWCFFINVPVGVAAFYMVSNFLRDPPALNTVKPKADWPGIGLLAVGLGALQYVLEEGNQDDWFQDPTILKLALFSAITLGAMFWWQLSPRNPQPVVDFRVLKNRDLASSLFLFVSLGFGLYGGVFIFPLLAQNVFGFSPTQTGLQTLPGGIATAVSSIVCGRILARGKLDPRILIFTGVAIFSLSQWKLGHLTIAAGADDVEIPLILRGLALGFLFAPINSVAFGNIDPKIAQQASGLINLARQLGGSFGIAALSTYLTQQIKIERALLVENVYAGNPVVDQRLAALTQGMMSKGADAETAHRMALAALDGTLMKQAAILAYN